jgi:hypothetical protein
MSINSILMANRMSAKRAPEGADVPALKGVAEGMSVQPPDLRRIPPSLGRTPLSPRPSPTQGCARQGPRFPRGTVMDGQTVRALGADAVCLFRMAISCLPLN